MKSFLILIIFAAGELGAATEQMLYKHELLSDRPKAISRVPLLINANRLQTVYFKIRPDMRSGQRGNCIPNI